MEMVRHDNESVKKKFSLTVIVEDGLLQQFRRGRDLKKTAAFSRHSGNQIRASFLGRKPHLSRINERPVAKATFFSGLNPKDSTASAPSVGGFRGT
jgi:hypothetical protein